LTQALEDMPAALRPFISEEDAVVRLRHLTRHGKVPPPIGPTSESVSCRARNGRVVTSAVRAPVSPAMRWMWEVATAFAPIHVPTASEPRAGMLRRDLPAPDPSLAGAVCEGLLTCPDL
jgi:hypothetical protein